MLSSCLWSSQRVRMPRTGAGAVVVGAAVAAGVVAGAAGAEARAGR